MRVLLLSHFPLNQSESGDHARRIATALQAAGHEPRVLVAAETTPIQMPFPVAAVEGTGIGTPSFSSPDGGVTFGDLSDAELSDYREAVRRRLDVEIAEFDPQVIHAQHVWISGQLALESGAPYVLTAWGAELEAATADPRYRPLADQAAENASRILAVDRSVQGRLCDRYESIADRIECVSPAAVETGGGFDLVALYELILRERFGD